MFPAQTEASAHLDLLSFPFRFRGLGKADFENSVFEFRVDSPEIDKVLSCPYIRVEKRSESPFSFQGKGSWKSNL